MKDPAISNDEKEKENLRFTSSNIATILHNFANETTAHGFAQLINAKGLLLKLFWIIGIIACYVFICLHVKTLIFRYNNKPIITNIYTKTEYAQPWPMIGICNENMIKSGKAHQLLSEIKKVNKEFNHTIREKIFDVSVAQLVQIIPHKIYYYGEQFEDLFCKCMLFQNQNCKAENKWRRVWLPHYGTCFVFNDKDLKSIVKIRGANRYDSMELVLNISQQQYLENETAAGARFFLGDQGSYYKPHEDGFNLSPGFSYDIILRKSRSIRVDPFKNNSCIPQSNITFSYMGRERSVKYDAKSCSLKCFSEEMEKTCNCIWYDLPKICHLSRICNSTDRKCYQRVRDKYVKGEIECLKSCLPPCQEINYETDISFLKYPNIAKAKENRERIEKVRQVREEIIKVKVYFKSLDVRVTEEKMTYAMEDLLSDIGGQLGLFSGYSVLTVIELVSLAVTISVYFISKAFN